VQIAALKDHKDKVKPVFLFYKVRSVFVAARRRYIRQRNTRVATGRFNDLHAWLKDAALFGVPDQIGANAALDRIGRVTPLDLAKHRSARALGDVVELDQRRMADGL
jgi:hypothetical protein